VTPIEIRPIPPSDSENPADRAALSKWLLRADPDAGTLTLTEDRPLLVLPTRTAVFSLPSTGRSDAVHAVCLVDYRWMKNMQTGITWRPLFLDGDGRTIGQGRMRDEPKASQMWPMSLFKPLESLGISVAQEQFATEKAFKQAHRGA
jgi:hypothetical protein